MDIPALSLQFEAAPLRPRPQRKTRAGRLLAWAFIALAAGCAGERERNENAAAGSISPEEARATIGRSLPSSLPDRTGWTTDLYAGFTVQSIAPTRENVCAVAAVIEQESNFRVDPVIPGLPAIAWREIDARATQAGVPRLVVHGMLSVPSSNGTTYGERIDSAKTEKQLSDVYEDFIAAMPLGKTLFADKNPIRTRGPMQVRTSFAEAYAAKRPYPYPVKTGIADEVFTRRGGLYFGIAHLLGYTEAAYDRYLYRFADFNAGQYASRNAAFQNALSIASGIPLVTDGALLPTAPDAKGAGATELAAQAMRGRLDLRDAEIRAALGEASTRDFETTTLYTRVYAAAEQTARHGLPRALVPHITLTGPKLSRKLTTAWYADRVDRRFRRCLAD